ncbi:MAG: NAD-dependent epimerase/dehydratase family protein [Alphaproteobacteria bacterium]|nr:NAD-dependent epimerase/dehydratase family protein [Alphaproteobacteria bacterium]
MKRLVVTGGAGAIGSRLVREVLKAGDEVAVLDDLSSGHRKLLPGNARLIEGSVVDDAALDAAFAIRPTHVVHAAALFANQNSVDHPEDDLAVNGLGTLKVLQRATKAGARVVYVSSSCVYGNKPAMREDDPELDPETPYAVTKLLGERYAAYFARHDRLDVVSVRLFNSYGPGEFPGRYRNVIPNFFALALEGKSLTITGTGEETRDFNFVGDTVGGILGALFGPGKAGAIYNIASGRETRIRDLAEKINAVTGNKAPIVFAPRRSWDGVLTRRGSIERARVDFGYRPTIELDQGLAETCAWLRAEGFGRG